MYTTLFISQGCQTTSKVTDQRYISTQQMEHSSNQLFLENNLKDKICSDYFKFKVLITTLQILKNVRKLKAVVDNSSSKDSFTWLPGKPSVISNSVFHVSQMSPRYRRFYRSLKGNTFSREFYTLIRVIKFCKNRLPDKRLKLQV